MNPKTLPSESVCEPNGEGPVTVSISRRIKPGLEAEYERWLTGIIEASATFEGYQGTNVLRPSAATDHEYVVIYRFDNFCHGKLWEQSELRREWRDQPEGLVEGDEKTRQTTGLEFWFDFPDIAAGQTASPHKMVIVLSVVLYLMAIPVHFFIVPLLEPVPQILRPLPLIVFQVLLLTYLVMPQVTRLLKPWLYPERQTAGSK
ncbi:MAG: antibiotic biosynthesis monooxygenase [Verrucomicrobiota bacterium]